MTPLRHNTNILDYFREHGKSEIFVANRYASIEGANNTPGGMIGFIYREMIRALMSLIFGGVPKDVIQRIEREASKAILTESKLDPAWDATEWLKRGPVRPRLEVIENLKNNRVLRAAVRKCARESKDSLIQYWAKMLRHNQVTARRKTRAAQRVGYNSIYSSLLAIANYWPFWQYFVAMDAVPSVPNAYGPHFGKPECGLFCEPDV